MSKLLAFITIVCSLLPVFSNAQTVEYTRDAIKIEDTDNIVLAGSFKDKIHLFKDNGWGSIELIYYNKDLTLAGKKQLDTEKGGYADIEIVPFANYYFALLKYEMNKRYKVFKIYANGDFEDKTSSLQQVYPLAFSEIAAPWSLRKVADRIFVINHVYNNAEKNILFNFFSLDSSLTKMDDRAIITNFHHGSDIINDILFADTATVYITRTYKFSTDLFGQVDITKYNLNSSTSNTINLSSNKELFYNPKLKYNVADSSFYFLSKLGDKATAGISPSDSRFYYVKMNRALEEIAPSILIPLKNADTDKLVLFVGEADRFPFIVENHKLPGSQNQQSGLSSGIRIANWNEGRGVVYSNPFDLLDRYTISPGLAQSANNSPYPITIAARFNPNFQRADLKMRIVLIDEVAAKKNEKRLSAKSGKFTSLFLNSFYFNSSSGSFIFFAKKYSILRKGMSYVSIVNGQVSDEEFLKVNLKYDYLLMLAKTVNETSFLVPYIDKKELGLVRVNL